jgi:hypothetical protein
MQKKSPLRTLSMDGVEGGSFSFHHGEIEYG